MEITKKHTWLGDVPIKSNTWANIVFCKDGASYLMHKTHASEQKARIGFLKCMAGPSKNIGVVNGPINGKHYLTGEPGTCVRKMNVTHAIQVPLKD